MNLREIELLVAQKECHTVEFKTSTTQLKGAMETICAFLNNQGGIVLIGVSNIGKMIGQDITDSTKQEIANELNKLEPPAEVHVNYIPLINNKYVIAFQVDTGKHAPYVYDHRPFQRNQSTTNRMQQHRYEQLLVKRGQLNHSWEEISTPYSTEDLDHVEIHQALGQGVAAGRVPADAHNFTIEEILASWHLVDNGKLNNAALVLFAKEPLPRYRQCHLKVGRFIGTDIIGDSIDNREYFGNAFHMLAEANLFTQRHLPIASFFEPNRFERIDKPTLPVLAVREALVNAICHRDYSNRAGYISVSIFDDRLEIWNSGTLPSELQLDDLKRKHKSVPRNKSIAKVFYDRKFFEGWGGGTVKMLNLCREADLPEPLFEEYSGGFGVTFNFRELILTTAATIPSVAISKLTHRQKEIVNILKKNGRMSLRDIISFLENPPASRTVGDDLAFLKQDGLVQTMGVGKGAKWFMSS